MARNGRQVAALVIGCALLIAIAVIGCDRQSATPVAQASATTKPESKQLWTCGMHPQVVQDHPGNCPICSMRLVPMRSKAVEAEDADGRSAGPSVRIDPAIVQNMGVRTALVRRGPLNLTVRAVGMLKIPEPGLHDVTLKFNGWIDKLYADTDGMMVSKGDPLFDVYSPDLQVAAEELIAAARTEKSPEAQTTEPVHKDAERMVESAKRKLRQWDIADEDIEAIAKSEQAPRTIPYRSPMDGHVTEKMIVQGSSVQMGMKLMRIEDHSRLWLDAEVYEEQLPWVHIGQTVEATLSGVPGKVFTGEVSFLYPHLDHMNRTETVRTILDNPGHKLRPGMYATVTISVQPVADAILVPREAVIDTGTRQIAFVVAADGRFEPRNVRMGMYGEEGVQILDGLAPGETVVTSGQFLLDVESRTTEAIEKLRGNSTSTDTPTTGKP